MGSLSISCASRLPIYTCCSLLIHNKKWAKGKKLKLDVQVVPSANLRLVLCCLEHLLDTGLIVFANHPHKRSCPNTKLIHIHLSVGRTTNETHSQHKLMMNQVHSKWIDQNVELIPCKSRLPRFPTAMSNQIHVLDLVTPIIHKPFIKKHRVFIVLNEQIRLLEAVRETGHLRYYLWRIQAQPSIIHVSLHFVRSKRRSTCVIVFGFWNKQLPFVRQ